MYKLKFLSFMSKITTGLSLRGRAHSAQRKFCNFKEDVAFNLSVTQSIPTSNEQMMKTKLRTFACEQILRGKHKVKPVGLYENTS